MPANVESLAYAKNRGLPWHRQGNGFAPGEVTSWNDMREKAGLTWEVAEEPVYVSRGGNFVEIPRWKNIYRDDQADTPNNLHVAKDSYAIIGHDALGEIIEAFWEVGNAKGNTLDWDTAGSLNGGRQVFVTAALGDYEIPGDPSPVRKFLVVTTYHDGTGACRPGQVDTRIVCANTFHSGEMELKRGGQFASLRHRPNFRKRMEEAKAALTQVNAASERTRKRAELLAQVPFTDDQIYELIDRLVPMPERDEDGGALSERKRNSIEAVRERMHFVAAEANPNLEGVRGSVWGALNAVGEFADHYANFRKEDTYIARTLIDQSDLKKRAQRFALDIANSGDGRKVKVAVSA